MESGLVAGCVTSQHIFMQIVNICLFFGRPRGMARFRHSVVFWTRFIPHREALLTTVSVRYDVLISPSE